MNPALVRSAGGEILEGVVKKITDVSDLQSVRWLICS